MSYKLIALDLDGTLLNEKKEVTARNKAAVKAVKEMGKDVVIATGRPYLGISKLLNELKLNTEADYVIAFNGAVVKNVGTGEIVYCGPVTHADYHGLYALSLELGVHIHALTETYVTTPVHNPYTKIESDINGIETVLCDVHAFPETETIIKVMFVDEKEKLDAVEKSLSDAIKSKYTVVRSAPIFLEFLNPNVDKGVGVAEVAKIKGLKPENVISVGDAGNDLAMIRYAGLGVAMGNAYDFVKEVADHITDTNEADGVAKVIETYMLS